MIRETANGHRGDRRGGWGEVRSEATGVEDRPRGARGESDAGSGSGPSDAATAAGAATKEDSPARNSAADDQGAKDDKVEDSAHPVQEKVDTGARQLFDAASHVALSGHCA